MTTGKRIWGVRSKGLGGRGEGSNSSPEEEIADRRRTTPLPTKSILGKKGGWGSKEKVGKAVALAKVSKVETKKAVTEAGGGGKKKATLLTRKEAPKFFALR